MKTISAIVMFIMPFALFAGSSGSIVGIWQNEEKNALIRIYEKDNRFYGCIVKIYGSEQSSSQKLDTKNPDKSLRKRKILGLVILKDLLYDSELSWTGGSIYDPNNGETYRATVTLADNGSTLQLRGYIGISLFGRTAEWKRFKGKLQ